LVVGWSIADFLARTSGDQAMSTAPEVERRRHERFRLPVMYTSVIAAPKAVPASESGVSVLEGHAYDISEGGVRIELDTPLDVGHAVDLLLNLPGAGDNIRASGEVAWFNQPDDDPGPRRMAVAFTQFSTPADQARLANYLRGIAQRAAA
jgi:hypothetical protein